MNILYVVGSGSKWADNELRYSLRSVEKYGRNVDNIFIVGRKPDFLNEKVILLPCDDPYPTKHKNIMYKIRQAIKKLPIGEHFLVSSDDHFYIKETDFDNYPVYFKNIEIPACTPAGYNTTDYWRSLAETRQLLLRKGLNIYQTNLHCNTHIDVTLWRENKELFREALMLPHGGEINLLMGNLLIAYGVEPVLMDDCKITNFKDIKQVKDRLAERECFSISDEAIKCGIVEYLNEKFPDKSKYEK